MPTLTTREKLIQSGHDLFYREGFLMVGLDRLLNDVGCSKQTFYNHFESKDELIVAVIDEHHRWWMTELRARLDSKASSPRDKILAMFDIMDDIIHDPEYRGCIFINAAVEFPQPHHPAHKSARIAKSDSVALLAELAKQAGAADPLALGQQIDMIMEGALITHQVAPDCDVCSTAKQLAEVILEKFLPVATP